MNSKIPEDWKMWAEENIQNGSDPKELIDEMIKAGFDELLSKKVISNIKIDMDAIEIGRLRYRDFENKRVIKAFIKRGLHKLGIYTKKELNIKSGQRYNSPLIELYEVPRFLNESECDQISALIKTKLRPSTIVHEGDYDKSIRTSSTCDLGHLESKVVSEIDDRICSMLGLDKSYSEITQGQQYEVGQEFKEHHDYFDGSDLLIEKHTKKLGQRTYTVMVYLNDVESGGETFFPSLNESFKPIKGTALVWNNLNYDDMPNINTIHQGKPVLHGHKSIITKWFREKRSGST
jgi:prolyl 4-hydroxylase